MRHLHQTPTLCCVSIESLKNKTLDTITWNPSDFQNAIHLLKLKVALLFLLLATVLVAGQRRTAGTGDNNIRLPRNVLPVRYDVRLFPVMEKGNFTILGRVSIDVQCKMETDRIVLHSLDIIVDPESVKVYEY